MKATEIKVPKFKSERQEAKWWDNHPEVVLRLFRQAKASGKLRRLESPGDLRGLLAAEAPVSKPVTIRFPANDLEKARKLAARKGLPYQTYMKILLREGLDRELRKAS